MREENSSQEGYFPSGHFQAKGGLSTTKPILFLDMRLFISDLLYNNIWLCFGPTQSLAFVFVVWRVSPLLVVEVNGGGQPSVVKARWILGQRNDRHNLLDVEKKSSGESSLFYPKIVGMHVKQTPKWSTVMIMYLLIAFQCYVLCYWIFIPFLLIPIEWNEW